MNIDKDYDKIKKGFDGEKYVRDLFIKSNIRHAQIDLMFEYQFNIYSVEIKHQEYYTSPPFDGHGLPPWQIKARISFYKTFNIIPIIIIRELYKDIIYINDLITLDSGKQFTTKGDNTRVIYPLDNFLKYDSTKIDKVIYKALSIIKNRF